MQPYAYVRATSLAEAVALTARPGHLAIAGGTEMVNWMKEGIVEPAVLVDLANLKELDRLQMDERGLVIGALAKMSDVAADPTVRRDWPAIAEALDKSASAQLRNMATMGGNLLQRTRCPYFRAEVELPCNKRRPGSGCSALAGEDRAMALFGWSKSCVATHASDVAVALAALDASVELQGTQGSRTILLTEFHRLPDTMPSVETVLSPGEMITAIRVPASPMARRSHYLKVRERASYEFALVSAAAGLDVVQGRIREARLALGGVAPKPWRLAEAESALEGIALADSRALRAALEPGFADARPLMHNGFKIELAKRTAVRALQTAGGVA